ncbi:MAG: hypothetical protein CMP05_06220 [Xanthomarina sp.]|uniref:T9SS type B sorting domain-containing protein n=1 Tax=Xanthomarina sp. TaxID=1931211 RepID=UPI000C5789E7|nr:T9SS type B sorting domain-containing protein [Xanthomarina sp.]MBF61578.1 hypothetical protein [Xanthomarina sp.]
MKILKIVFFLVSSTVFSQDLTDNLLLYYSFDGDTNDSSINGNDGINFGATFANDRFGNPNSAIYFDGVNDYVNFPNISELKPDLPISFSFWIKYESYNSDDRDVFNTSFEEDRNTGVYFNSQMSTGNYAINYGDGSYSYVTSTRRSFVTNEAIDTNNWHQIIIIINSANNMKIYVDCMDNGGVYSGSGGALQYSASSGCIGRHDRDLGAPANYFKGAIDDFRYWNRELTVDNIAELLGVNYNVSNMTTSTSCGSNDGTITISGLTSGNNYTITYIHNSVTETLSITADASGNYIITGLESGIYDSILVTENVTGCQDDLGQVVIDEPDLALSVASTDLTSCGSDDGTITISELTSGNSYTITYIHNSVTETLSITADASGNYIITGLESGIYNSILVTENVTGCQDDLGQVIVECFDQGLPCFKTKLVFTPNGDGINDYWNLIISSNACDYIVYIYDRYGKLLKTLSPENNKWDGTFRGYNLPSNDYWYVVEYKIDDKKYTYKSHFALKR